MKNYISFFKIIVVSIILLSISCKRDSSQNSKLKRTQVAFLADIHLLDIYGQFSDTNYKGIKNPDDGRYVNIRTMKAQLSSTRLFNENYFALISALDDIVKRGVKFIVIPGDFSDDGQAFNINGVKRIFNEYSARYGIEFITTTGNHDPCYPFNNESGKSDFMGKGGKEQPIMSQDGMYKFDKKRQHPTIVTKDIKECGYRDIILTLKDFGFYPKESYLYWETPFSPYDYKTYTYKKAKTASKIKERVFVSNNSHKLPDVSYLVEPIEGVWFLAIDANVYIAKKNGWSDPKNPKHYKGASLGYKNMLTQKQHLFEWIKKVTQRASKLGKSLVVFSHYPTVGFNDGMTQNIENLLGKGAMQSYRIPPKEISDLFIKAGVKVHFGGHMHINDTGIHRLNGDQLINIQVPSLGAYIPAYKLLTIKNNKEWVIQTIKIKEVPNFNSLFSLYEMEHNYLMRTKSNSIWDKSILKSKNYQEFTSMHLKSLVNKNFLINDWDEKFFLNKTGNEIDAYLNQHSDNQFCNSKTAYNWKGKDLIFDLYRLRSADRLAIEDIGQKRINEYTSVLKKALQIKTKNKELEQFQDLAKIFFGFLNGEPADNFTINLETGELSENI